VNVERNYALGGARDPIVTICVLCYGDYTELARRAIDSILAHGDRSRYDLFVGANMVNRATASYLHALAHAGRVDRLIESPTNINKCPMMRRLFAEVRTPLIWWFDDDSYIAEPDAMSRWLAAAEQSAADTVMWGHQFFFGHERDFSYGTDVVGFVKSAPWYRGKAPPSWDPGGKDVWNFQGQGTGDGRWFFLTGGCWMARTESLRSLEWPDRRLIKRNDDVFLAEAIRQQDWQVFDVGSSGVAINASPRRGEGEDADAMRRQLSSAPESEPSVARGAVFIPSFEDSELLAGNFGDRPGIFGDLDVFIVDDANDSDEASRLRALCDRNGWTYWTSGRAPHVPQGDAWWDCSAYNRFIWETFLRLGATYDFVIKVDTDAYLIDRDWSIEFSNVLSTGSVIAGTGELRPTRDVGAFWEIARKSGWQADPGEYVAHTQGGIYGLSRSAIELLRTMGFLEGTHTFFSEDCYISYCCQLLGVTRVETQTVGSWHQPYRPMLDTIDHLLAIHPLTRREWEDHDASRASSRRGAQGSQSVLVSAER